MTTKTRNRLGWAVNALTVVLLVCFGLWSVQLREQQRQKMSRAEVVAEAILLSDTAVIGVGSDGVIAEWNEAATALTGYSQKEAIGEPLVFLVPDEWKQQHEEGIAGAVQRGSLRRPVQQVSCSVTAKCGTQVPVIFSLRMIDAGEVQFLATMNAADQVQQIDLQSLDPI